MNEAYFMDAALQEAEQALKKNEVPVGAVISCQGRIVARAHNSCESLQDTSAHAEILALGTASNYLGSKYLGNCTLYVTLEPCAMCAAATKWAQIESIVYAASDPKQGFLQYTPGLTHPKTRITQGPFSREAEMLLRNFFQNVR